MAPVSGRGTKKVSFPQPARFSVGSTGRGAPSARSSNPTLAPRPALRPWQGTCAAVSLGLPDGEAGRGVGERREVNDSTAWV